MITIALSKGRILKEELSLFYNIGFDFSPIQKDDRKLFFDFPKEGFRIMLLKPFDIPVYVERGSADIGIVGKDVIMELCSDVLQILDLGIGKCRISLAGKSKKTNVFSKKIKVGTKFPTIAKAFFNSLGKNVELIKLEGSIELAPLTGVTDFIVDIVSSGETLRKNGLIEIEKICDISSYLIANRTSFKIYFDEVNNLIKKLMKVVG